MKIEIEKATDWKRVIDAAKFTQHEGRTDIEPSDAKKKKYLIAEHSPIRLLEFDIRIYDVPYSSVMHFVRHFMGVEKFVATSRPDITGKMISRHEQRKDDPTDVQFSINAQAIINVSLRRNCYKAEKNTREIWEAVREKMKQVDPQVASVMVPNCVLRNGFCGEFKPCGYCFTKEFEKELESYQQYSKWKEMKNNK